MEVTNIKTNVEAVHEAAHEVAELLVERIKNRTRIVGEGEDAANAEKLRDELAERAVMSQMPFLYNLSLDSLQAIKTSCTNELTKRERKKRRNKK